MGILLFVLAERLLELTITLEKGLDVAVSVITLVVTLVFASTGFAGITVLMVRISIRSHRREGDVIRVVLHHISNRYRLVC